MASLSLPPSLDEDFELFKKTMGRETVSISGDSVSRKKRALGNILSYFKTNPPSSGVAKQYFKQILHTGLISNIDNPAEKCREYAVMLLCLAVSSKWIDDTSELLTESVNKLTERLTSSPVKESSEEMRIVYLQYFVCLLNSDFLSTTSVLSVLNHLWKISSRSACDTCPAVKINTALLVTTLCAKMSDNDNFSIQCGFEKQILRNLCHQR